jgi:ribosomal protein S18 acetylase RimI-like enzyme
MMGVRPSTLEEIRKVFVAEWGADCVVSRGRIHTAGTVQGLCAMLEGQIVGLLTYRMSDGDCEIVSLNSFRQNMGAGTLLIQKATEIARQSSCRRLWMITTNDNLRAFRFYQKRGFDLVAVHRNAIQRSRELKPTIPALGMDGIPIRHELEMERLL